MPVYSSEDLSKIQSILGYTFKNPRNLIVALTHSSYANEHPEEGEDNERLEFLGDAVLGLAVSEFLYKEKGPLKESEMARFKAFLVSKKSLAEIASEIGLGEYIRLGRGEERSGGRTKENILADALEAIIGAIFLEGGYRKASKVIKRIFGEKLKRSIKKGLFYDYKTLLQEITQSRFGIQPRYETVSESGKDHEKVFTVEVKINGRSVGIGRGKSKKEAQMEAAKEAIKKLSL